MNNTVSCKSPSIELPEPIWCTDSHIDGKGEPCYLVDEVYEIVEKLTTGVTSEAVGGDEPFCYAPSGMFDPCYAEQHFTVSRFRILPDAVPLYTQPQQLAVTDEAVIAAIKALPDFREDDLDAEMQTQMRIALEAALPHLARKETM